MKFIKNYSVIFLLIISMLLIAIRIFYVENSPLNLAPDEAQYWDWSRHLDWSYYSKPPMVAWLIALSTHYLGNVEVGVRFFSIIGVSILSLLAFFIVRTVKSETESKELATKAGLFAFFLVNITPMFAVGGLIMSPDVPTLIFWVSALYMLTKIDFLDYNKDQWGQFILIGVLIGLAGLSKYTAGLFYPLLGLYLIFSKERLPWLLKPQIYVAGLISLIMLAPVFYWNHINDWISFKHVMGQASGGNDFAPLKYLGNFLGGQLGVVGPIVFIFMLWAWFKTYTKKTTKQAIIWWFSAPIFIFFIIKAFDAKVQANWPVLAIFGGLLILALTADKITSKWAKITFGIGLAFSAVLTIISHDTFIVRNLGIEWSIKKDPLRPVMGWKDLGNVTGLVADKIDQDTVFMTGRYQTASELAFYIPGQPEIMYVNPGYRRQNQYDYWPWPEDLEDKVFIYIREGGPIEPQIEKAFKSCVIMARPAITRGNIAVRFANIYACGGYLGLNRKKADKY